MSIPRIISPDDLTVAETPLRRWVSAVTNVPDSSVSLEEWLLCPCQERQGGDGTSNSENSDPRPLLLHLIEKVQNKRNNRSGRKKAAPSPPKKDQDNNGEGNLGSSGNNVNQVGICKNNNPDKGSPSPVVPVVSIASVVAVTVALARILGSHEWFASDFLQKPKRQKLQKMRMSQRLLDLRDEVENFSAEMSERCVERWRKKNGGLEGDGVGTGKANEGTGGAGSEQQMKGESAKIDDSGKKNIDKNQDNKDNTDKTVRETDTDANASADVKIRTNFIDKHKMNKTKPYNDAKSDADSDSNSDKYADDLLLNKKRISVGSDGGSRGSSPAMSDNDRVSEDYSLVLDSEARARQTEVSVVDAIDLVLNGLEGIEGIDGDIRTNENLVVGRLIQQGESSDIDEPTVTTDNVRPTLPIPSPTVPENAIPISLSSAVSSPILPPGLSCRLQKDQEALRIAANLREILVALHELCRRDFFYQGPLIPDDKIPRGIDKVLDEEVFADGAIGVELNANETAENDEKEPLNVQAVVSTSSVIKKLGEGPPGVSLQQPPKKSLKNIQKNSFRFSARQTLHATIVQTPRTSRFSHSPMSTPSTIASPSDALNFHMLGDDFELNGENTHSKDEETPDASGEQHEQLASRARPIWNWIKEVLGRTEDFVSVDEFGNAIRADNMQGKDTGGGGIGIEGDGIGDDGGDRFQFELGNNGLGGNTLGGDFGTAGELNSLWDGFQHEDDTERVKEKNLVHFREEVDIKMALSGQHPKNEDFISDIDGESSILSEISYSSAEGKSGKSSELSVLTASIDVSHVDRSPCSFSSRNHLRSRLHLRSRFQKHFASHYGKYWAGPQTFSDLRDGRILCDLLMKLLYFDAVTTNLSCNESAINASLLLDGDPKAPSIFISRSREDEQMDKRFFTAPPS